MFFDCSFSSTNVQIHVLFLPYLMFRTYNMSVLKGPLTCTSGASYWFIAIMAADACIVGEFMRIWLTVCVSFDLDEVLFN